MIDHENDPLSYNETLEDVDVQEWLKAMDYKMKSMYSYLVLSLIKAPKGIELIGYKWIYKRKRTKRKV